MSDDRISLDFLGEQMLRMQGEMRELRAGYSRIGENMQGIGAKLGNMDAKLAGVDAKFEQVDARFDRNESNVLGLAGKLDHLEKKVDAHQAASNVRFDQINQTMTTHLEIVLNSIAALDRKVDGKA